MNRALALCFLLLAFCAAEPAPPPPAPEKPAPPPPPSLSEARASIASAPELGEFEFTHAGYSLPMDRSLRHAAANEVAKKLAEAKWIAFDSGGKVTLTPKSSADKRFLARPNGILDIVPLAKKEMGEVTAVRPNPDGTVSAEFTWTWTPNEIGVLLEDRYAGTQTSTATMMWNGTTWQVLSIRR